MHDEKLIHVFTSICRYTSKLYPVPSQDLPGCCRRTVSLVRMRDRLTLSC